MIQVEIANLTNIVRVRKSRKRMSTGAGSTSKFAQEHMNR